MIRWLKSPNGKMGKTLLLQYCIHFVWNSSIILGFVLFPSKKCYSVLKYLRQSNKAMKLRCNETWYQTCCQQFKSYNSLESMVYDEVNSWSELNYPRASSFVCIRTFSQIKFEYLWNRYLDMCYSLIELWIVHEINCAMFMIKVIRKLAYRKMLFF